MTFLRTERNTSRTDPLKPPPSFERPRFNSQITADRLREDAKFVALSMSSSKIKRGRKSVFREIGLDDDGDDVDRRDSVGSLPSFDEKQFGKITGLSSEEVNPNICKRKGSVTSVSGSSTRGERSRWLSKLTSAKRPKIKAAAASPNSTLVGLHSFSMIALVFAVLLPTVSFNNGKTKVEMSGAGASPIRTPMPGPTLENRANSPTDVCKRWAGQSAELNGTLYYYGGRSITSGDQTTNEWNNDFITLDLTKSWSIQSPALSGLPQPSGPPAVSLGYLWNSYDSLFLYGGEFDYPSTLPVTVATWQYDIASSTWTEFSNPVTDTGQFSDPGGVAVQRAAEGAGISVPELGLSWFFGGHLDWATTPGWSNQIDRVYLKSLLEFTHPGYANAQVESLQGSGAPNGGAYRNVTWGGVQNQVGFTERADGVLVYVPGWGQDGILLGLGGGVVGADETTDAFASMTTIDVYDIASSEWYHQNTSGTSIPQVRVNPCAVVFSAPDASSFNIYMYGGQNLVPIGQQIQYADIWILTIPSFTWIQVDPTGDEPAARAGHSCAARDGQIVVVGGYIGNTSTCEQPGIYAFNASTLAWETSFTAGDHAPDANDDNSVLAGSWGYEVPGIVQSVIGGSSSGGATVSTPASGPATAGPFKTGVPPVYTITEPGYTATITNPAPSNTGGSIPPVTTGSNGSGSESSARKDGTIAAGVVAGLAGTLALYLGFCAWLWRRQVRAYRRHMAVANRYAGTGEYDYNSGGGGSGGGGNSNNPANEYFSAAAAATSEKLRKKAPSHRRMSSSGTGGRNAACTNPFGSDSPNHFAWVGQLGEPKFIPGSEEPSPGSGTGSGTGTGSSSIGRSGGPRHSEDRGSLWAYGYDSYLGGPGDGDTVMGGDHRPHSRGESGRSTHSGGSADALLEGREPHFFSVVLGPRRALRVVNGIEE
ncbi:hypothetical protein F5Y16DRAFT_384945 [Xylariaceae sp. FL0255]|nr:hypothetical protein F5Y16DRAFT_384945 [Xylariaceae sp. FL0255]